eukprot:TRINITY_DN73886_c0_g1_i1.p1 TRINITY_DN73886_c0_g1~~TRINITY_DN73886_c0_g1_i1.p1  ORF type:complete len:309 (-),score=51.54 TRINITY_DN73886_c0_g1_i1:164-1057(-)
MANMETSDEWCMVFCYEQALEDPLLDTCSMLVSELKAARGHLVRQERAREFYGWLQYSSMPYILMADWHEIEPCIEVLQECPQSWMPCAIYVISGPGEALACAKRWASSQADAWDIKVVPELTAAVIIGCLQTFWNEGCGTPSTDCVSECSSNRAYSHGAIDFHLDDCTPTCMELDSFSQILPTREQTRGTQTYFGAPSSKESQADLEAIQFNNVSSEWPKRTKLRPTKNIFVPRLSVMPLDTCMQALDPVQSAFEAASPDTSHIILTSLLDAAKDPRRAREVEELLVSQMPDSYCD